MSVVTENIDRYYDCYDNGDVSCKNSTKQNHARCLQACNKHYPNTSCKDCRLVINVIPFQCQHLCKMRQLVNKVGCTGPWIPEVGADVPLCNNYETMKNLTKDYVNK